MEILLGKTSQWIDGELFRRKRAAYGQVWIDIGTGDGHFVLHAARSNPQALVIGLDACRENLSGASRQAPENALFVIANALSLPGELRGLAARLTVNFPWGSLLAGLLDGHTGLLDGLRSLACPPTVLEVRLNGEALSVAGLSLEEGGRQVQNTLQAAGLRVQNSTLLEKTALRACPSTWARRLAFGRFPHAVVVSGRWV